MLSVLLCLLQQGKHHHTNNVDVLSNFTAYCYICFLGDFLQNVFYSLRPEVFFFVLIRNKKRKMCTIQYDNGPGQCSIVMLLRCVTF